MKPSWVLQHPSQVLVLLAQRGALQTVLAVQSCLACSLLQRCSIAHLRSWPSRKRAHVWALMLYCIMSEGKIWANSTCSPGALLSQS